MAINALNPDQGRILLSGASGMLGSAIGEELRRQEANVLRLVRHKAPGPDELHWNPAGAQIDDLKSLENLHAAIHLSGANVASQRWTAAYKQEMAESRVGSTRVLAEALARLKKPPRVLITASATGFYGDRGDEILDESSAVGRGYFPELCATWEGATRPAKEAGIRVVHLRFGMVISRNGGALAKLAPLFRLGLGGRLGNGKQWVSWVSEADAVSAAMFSLENPAISGPVNVVAPEPVTNAVFTREFGRAVHRPALLPAPAFALRLAFGDMADEALLASTRVLPRRLLQAGIAFVHPTLPEALAAALAK
jgi:uncharacterized protein (TIGR01777 family)